MGYILNVNGIFIGFINLLTPFESKKFPNLAKDRYFVCVFCENQYEVNLSAKKIGNHIFSFKQRLFFKQKL